jgi:hypothetical protein
VDEFIPGAVPAVKKKKGRPRRKKRLSAQVILKQVVMASIAPLAPKADL